MGTNVVSSWVQVVKLLRNGTKDPASCADASLNDRVGTLVNKLKVLPPCPRSVWKALLQQQVPLHIATALSAAAQHNPKSHGMNAVLFTLEGLLETATTSALIKDGAAVDSLAISIRQQLQQAGVLQQLAGAMAALAADMHSGAADLGANSQEQLCMNLRCFKVNNTAMLLDLPCMTCLQLSRLHRLLRNLWRSPGQSDVASSMAWVCDPSGYPEAAMQLCTAALRHVSSLLQHVLPDSVQVELVAGQQATLTAIMELGRDMVVGVRDWKSHCDKPGGFNQEWSSTAASLDAQAQQRLQQLLLSPHCLPFFASTLLLTVTWFSTNCLPAATNSNSNSVPGSSSNSSSSGRRPGDVLLVRTSEQHGREQGAAQAATSSNREGAQRQVEGDSPLTPCQHKLFELLGLSPQLTGMMEPALSPAPPATALSNDQRLSRVSSTVTACTFCCGVLIDMLCAPGGKQQVGADPQRWQLEQQLWLLLPSVLLPCARKLWPVSGTPEERAQRRFDEVNAMVLLVLCSKAQIAANNLYVCLGADVVEFRLPHPAWSQEVFGGVLQLADQLLLQQGWHGQAASSAPCQSQSSSSSSSALSSNLTGQGGVAQVVLDLLMMSLSIFNSSAASPLRRRLGFSSTHGGAGPAFGDVVVVPGSIAIERQLDGPGALTKLYTVAEGGLRLITTAIQRGVMQPPQDTLASSLQWLVGISGGAARSMLSLHSGNLGLEVLIQEQRQLYSMLNTLQKLSMLQKLRNQAGVAATPELCWGQQAAGRCCWEVGEEAADLMKTVMLLARPAAAPAAAAVDQQAPAARAAQGGQDVPEMEFLPSLVLLGRCCLIWAEQLRKQTPELMLLLASGAAVQQPQQGGVRVKHSAAWVCIPGAQEGGAAASAQSCGLEKLVAIVSSWVGVATAPAVHTALAAAAGGDPQQFRQQLEALSAAQAAVRHEGVSDASLAALVQQLQATGVMLSSIAVPHFCNNPACVNISGPTEVQLVSGHSCICAGCRTARYCGRGCQRQAWRQHKPVCKALAAAAAAVGTQG